MNAQGFRKQGECQFVGNREQMSQDFIGLVQSWLTHLMVPITIGKRFLLTYKQYKK